MMDARIWSVASSSPRKRAGPDLGIAGIGIVGEVSWKSEVKKGRWARWTALTGV